MNKIIALVVGIVLAASGLTLAPAANADTTTPPSGPVNVDSIPDVVDSMTKITSSVYNEQSLTENVTAELIQSAEAEIGPDGKTKDGRIAVAYEQTDVKSMKLKKVLKRCVKITHNVKQLRKAMKTKKFQKYGLVCFKKGVKLVERFKTKTGYIWIKMPPVWGKWRIAKHEGKALRAQGTWFSKAQLRNPRVRAHLINELNVSPADIDEAIAAGGGWFLMCGNKLALVKVRSTHYRKTKMFKAFLQQEAQHLYRLTKQVTSLGGAKAEGEQPCGPANVRGEANSMLFSNVHSTIEIYASSEQEAKIKGAGRLTATLEMAMTARNNITSKLTQWGQVSIVMECKYTPQPPPPAETPEPVITDFRVKNDLEVDAQGQACATFVLAQGRTATLKFSTFFGAVVGTSQYTVTSADSNKEYCVNIKAPSEVPQGDQAAGIPAGKDRVFYTIVDNASGKKDSKSADYTVHPRAPHPV